MPPAVKSILQHPAQRIPVIRRVQERCGFDAPCAGKGLHHAAVAVVYFRRPFKRLTGKPPFAADRHQRKGGQTADQRSGNTKGRKHGDLPGASTVPAERSRDPSLTSSPA